VGDSEQVLAMPGRRQVDGEVTTRSTHLFGRSRLGATGE